VSISPSFHACLTLERAPSESTQSTQYRISAVRLIAQTGLQFDLSTPQGKLVASIMAALAEFEPDSSIGERIRSGIASAHARRVKSGKRPGQRVKAERLAPKVLQLVSEGRCYRFIAKKLHLDKNTVNAMVKRHKQSLKHSSHIE
jgi:putative DNA-invertase from lambdoid prophage Rac